MASEKDIRISLLDNTEKMVKALYRGNDLEIRTTPNGVRVLVVDKKILK